VSRGKTEVLGLDTGVRVIVNEGYANITRRNERPSSPIIVPDIPELKVAEIEGQSTANNKKERAGIPEGDWKYYRIQLAQDVNFSHIEKEEKNVLTKRRLPWENKTFMLPNGTYFARISYYDPAGNESKFYYLPPITINTHNPELVLISPEDKSRTFKTFAYVKGRTQIGMILTVNDYPIEVNSDGTFSWSVMLNEDKPTKIKVVATDASDNKTVLERTVYRYGQK
jgi:hypothetical protein